MTRRVEAAEQYVTVSNLAAFHGPNAAPPIWSASWSSLTVA
jgi:hypothetical protein